MVVTSSDFAPALPLASAGGLSNVPDQVLIFDSTVSTPGWRTVCIACGDVGVFALLIGLPAPVGAALMVLGSLGMVAIFAVIVRMHRALYTMTMALGAVAWLTGNVLWLMGLPVFRIVWWWGAFLVLTIAGERLEMSRVMRVSRFGQAFFGGTVVLLFIGLTLVGLKLDPGWRVTGTAMLAMSVWLLRYDIARRTARQSGLRFIALNLLAGFVWLAVSGSLLIAWGRFLPGRATTLCCTRSCSVLSLG